MATVSKHEAIRVASLITNDELKQMFINARTDKDIDWSAKARVMKGSTRGNAFNVLSKSFNGAAHSTRREYGLQNKIVMVTEFWEYLPSYLRHGKKDENKKPEPPKGPTLF